MFPGNNSLHLNAATIIEALNEYIDKRRNQLGVRAIVTAVKPGANGEFIVSLQEEKTKAGKASE